MVSQFHSTPPPDADILVVDDDYDLVRSLARVIRMHGYPVRVATSGQQALDLIHERCPAVVLTDVHMPDFDGVELAREVREQSLSTDVIFMTADLRLEAQGTRQAAQRVLVKPFRLEELWELLEHSGCSGPSTPPAP